MYDSQTPSKHFHHVFFKEVILPNSTLIFKHTSSNISLVIEKLSSPKFITKTMILQQLK